MKYSIEHGMIVDGRQSAWQLASIQLSAVISLPSLSSSIFLMQKYSFYSSIITLIVCNFILWVIRFGLLKLSFRKRKSTLDIAYDCFGKFGSYIISIALLIDTLAWFFTHTSVASSLLISLFNFEAFPGTNHFIQLSIIIGVLSTLLCMEGVKSLKILALASLPILLITLFGTLASSSFPKEVLNNSFDYNFSFAGIGLVIGSSLGFSVDLPTFFRHRKSWKDSINALALFQVVSLVISISGLFLAKIIHIGSGNSEYAFIAISSPQKYLLSIFLIVSVVYANVYNIYSSSVGWEVLAPASLVGRKEYMILGLALTILFISFYGIFSLHRLLDIADSAMINLSIVLFWFFITQILVGRNLAVSGKYVYLFSWLLSLLLNIIQLFHYGFISNYMILTSFLFISFFSIFNIIKGVLCRKS